MESIALTPMHRDTALKDFLPVPRSLLTLNLPYSAVLLYGELLNRSRYTRFADALDRVYVIYTVADLAGALGVKTRCIQTGLNQLEEYGLIRRTRPVGNRASHIFLNIPAVSQGTASACAKSHPWVQEQTGSTGSKVHTNRNKNRNNKRYLYQHDGEDSL